MAIQIQHESGRGGWHWYLLVLLFALSMRGCGAVEHLVGADRGWDPSSPLHFNEWASRNIFRVGDNLWFAYSSASQSVAELSSHEEWEACNLSNPIRLYNRGIDSVPLVQKGSRYFASGRMEDCLLNGMKLHINVLPNTNTKAKHSHSQLIAQPPKSSAISLSLSLSLFSVFTCLFILSLSLSL